MRDSSASEVPPNPRKTAQREVTAGDGELGNWEATMRCHRLVDVGGLYLLAEDAHATLLRRGRDNRA